MEAPGRSHTQCFNVNGPKDIEWFMHEYSRGNGRSGFNYAAYVNSWANMSEVFKNIDEKFAFIGTLEDISNSKDMMEYTMGSTVWTNEKKRAIKEKWDSRVKTI